MNLRDFFLAAMAAGEFRRRAWVISAFSIIQEGPEDWKKDPYPYRIVQTPTAHFYVDPDKGNELTVLAGSVGGAPPFSPKSQLQLTAGEVPNLEEDITTNYGRLLANYTVLIYPFGKKIPYINKRFTTGDVEDLIVKRLQDIPAEGQERDDKWIYIDEYLKFTDAAFYTVAFTQLCVPAGTPKTMTAAPGIEDLKAKLLEENKERLHDPTVIAKISQELVAYDRAYLKGDPGENFLISGKSFNVVRSKLFNMHGAETGFDAGVDVTLIPNSLSQGWDISKFPAMLTASRKGSFNRGQETMRGGEAVKWLLRASSNLTVTKDDCGTEFGIDFSPTESNFTWLTGFSLVTQGGAKLVETDEDAKSYLGKRVRVRSPMFCKLDKTDFCKTCVGARLALNPTALSSAVSEMGSTMMLIFMSAMHGKALTLAKMEIKTALT